MQTQLELSFWITEWWRRRISAERLGNVSRLHDGVMGGDGDGQIAQCLGDMLLMNMTEVDRVTHPTEPKIKALSAYQINSGRQKERVVG